MSDVPKPIPNRALASAPTLEGIRFGSSSVGTRSASTRSEMANKLQILADAAKYDASCASSGSHRKRSEGGIGNSNGVGICHSYAPDGRCISLLKILLTNYCIYDCQFCINRISSNTPRARFSPEEVAELTIEFYKRNYIEGLFLSSGIIQSADYTMEQLVRCAELLRTEKKFCGYIHLKAIAGASPELLRRAGRYADRLSANIELPRQIDLQQLAPAKMHSVIESSMGVIRDSIVEAREHKQFRARRRSSSAQSGVSSPAESARLAPTEQAALTGQSTQLIVGATAATDFDLLHKAKSLYQVQHLKRVYYSAFSPIPDSAPGVPVLAAPLIREHRLYQADWLQRFYNFSLEELVSPDAPQLSLDHDPKMGWALRNRAVFPIDVNRADRLLLLRVPGFGVRTVQRILKARQFQRLRLADLARMRVPLSRAKYFIQTIDYNIALRSLDALALPNTKKLEQLSLFEANVAATTGEM